VLGRSVGGQGRKASGSADTNRRREPELQQPGVGENPSYSNRLRRGLELQQAARRSIGGTFHQGRAMHRLEVWIKGLLAAAIAGAANGVITGFAAVGIDPNTFNLQAGFAATLKIAAVSAAMSALIGAAAYLKQSPLPGD
jgi:hypothetical protein